MGRLLPRKELEAKLAAARDKPVKLRVVASMLNHERTRRRRDSMRGPDYLALLNEAARALSDVIDIYHVSDGKLSLVPRGEVAGAAFHDGGNILRSSTGNVYHRLTVRRGQAIAAITVLAEIRAEA